MTPTQTPQPQQTMADQLDALDEKLTMIMDHLGIQAPDDSENSSDNPTDDSGQSMMDKITNPKGE